MKAVVNKGATQGAVHSSNSFCLLSELMLSPRHHELVIADKGGCDIAWHQFRYDVEVVASHIKKSQQLRWALCFDDSYYFAVAFFAAAYAGKEIILPGNYQSAALAELAEHYDAIIHDRTELQQLDCYQKYLPETLNRNSEAELFSSSLSKDTSVTLFTSGSSGTPKAVRKKLLHLEAEIAELEKTWGDKVKGTRVVSTVSHQHIYGLLFRVLWPLCGGRAFDRYMLNYPEQVMGCADADIVLITSPALLKRLVQEQKTQPYRAIFSSGGPLSEQAAHQCQELFNQLPFEVLGSSETGGIGFRQQYSCETPWQLFGVIEMALNEESCLRVRSPFIDYDTWYQTSDQCRLMPGNQFMLLGRTDRVVKVEEKRISLPEVEQRLCQLNWVDEAAVITVNEESRLILAAVLTLSMDGEKQRQTVGKGRFGLEIRRELRKWLEPVGIPRRFRFVDEIPLNSQGKRQVRELEQFF
ncbi:AMP-binding protein [Photobacterium sp. J15]|uniref:AMP-binding protein n=1 Tax=Photobacterium sp. J15 TaxID=265901 RepID=UPI0007E3ABE2|nr:AMP-binding protein [Photobacterium sp. J15]